MKISDFTLRKVVLTLVNTLGMGFCLTLRSYYQPNNDNYILQTQREKGYT